MNQAPDQDKTIRSFLVLLLWPLLIFGYIKRLFKVSNESYDTPNAIINPDGTLQSPPPRKFPLKPVLIIGGIVVVVIAVGVIIYSAKRPQSNSAPNAQAGINTEGSSSLVDNYSSSDGVSLWPINYTAGSDSSTGTGMLDAFTNADPTNTSGPTAPNGIVDAAPPDTVNAGSVRVAADSGTQITLTWDAVPGATQYRVEWSPDPNFGAATTKSLYTGTNSCVIVGLNPQTKYYFRITAINSAGAGGSTGGSSGTTTTVVRPAPGVPNPISAQTIAANAIKLSWGTTANATGYSVRRATDAAFQTNAKEYASTRSTTFTVQDLAPNTLYYFQVQANNLGTVGPWSTPISIRTMSMPPTAISLVPKNESTIGVSWNPVSGSTRYDVRYTSTGNFTGATIVSTTGVSMDITGLASGTNYGFQVRAFVENRTSEWSATVSQITPGPVVTTPGGGGTGGGGTGSGGLINIATFNSLSEGFDNDNSREFAYPPYLVWDDRKGFLRNTVIAHDLDIVGFQEVWRATQYNDLVRLLAGYSNTGGSDNDKRNVIFYKNALFDVSAKGSYKVAGEDSKYCTWALMNRKADAKKFYVFSCHLSFRDGNPARESGAKETANRAASMNTNGYPVIILGDMNSSDTNSTSPYGIFKSRGYTDTYEISASKVNGGYSTFHGYDYKKAVAANNGHHIDHLFVSSNISSLKYQILVELTVKKRPSDHFPVMSTIQFK